MTSNPPPAPPGLAAKRLPIAVSLFVLAACGAAAAIVLTVRYQSGALYNPVFYWVLALLMTGVIGGLMALVYEPQEVTESEKLRVILLAVGGAAGFATFVLGLLLPWTNYSEVLAAGRASWRANPSALVWTGAATLGGLVLMFASLQLARGAERASGAMRRLLYGSNAVFGTLLLVGILGLVNVLSFIPVWPFNVSARTLDATGGGTYSLEPATRNFLADLKEPVTAYVIIPENDLVGQDVKTLLENFRTITPQLTWKSVSRDRDREEIVKLKRQYTLPDTLGVLLLYGTGASTAYDFVKYEDLFRDARGRRGEPVSYVFVGEDALMKSLRYLSEGKTHPVVYFTQGEGEMDLGSGAARGRRGEEGLSDLRSRLEQGNYTVKPLEFGPTTRAVPADASVVIVARPTRPFSAEAVKALHDYMSGAGGKKGRLVVLLDVVIENGRMVQTGLEPLLAEYNVKVGNGRIISLRNEGARLEAVANPNSNNPVAEAFTPTSDQFIFFRFDGARTVSPLAPQNPARPMGGAYNVSELLLVPPALWVFEETDLNKEPTALAAALRKDREEANRRISQRPLSVAVTVSEGGRNPLQNIPGHEGLNTGKETPRMVVFGDAGWVSNDALNEQGGRVNYSLFASCLAWLRERPEVGKQAESKERKEYSLNVPGLAITRIEYLPLPLMVLGVVGLGVGVWAVRRR
jgi:hypothetical protein